MHSAQHNYAIGCTCDGQAPSVHVLEMTRNGAGVRGIGGGGVEDGWIGLWHKLNPTPLPEPDPPAWQNAECKLVGQ